MHAPELFRPAPIRSRGANLLWTLAQCAIIWPVFLVFAPILMVMAGDQLGLQEFHFSWQRVVAVLLFLAFSALNLTTGFVLATKGSGTPLPIACPRTLVIEGPYRYVRNPMAIAGIGQGFAIGLWAGSWTIIMYAFAGALLWHLILRPIEERDMMSRFGREYEAYRQQVPLWLPQAHAFVAAQ